MVAPGELIRLRLAEFAEPLVIALSGGADSAAAAWGAAARRGPSRAVHVDHGLAASPGLRRAAMAIAGRLELDLSVVEIAARSPSEADLRSARYEAMLAELAPAELLVTAHSRDDRIETVLINLLRGTGPAGLAGIPRRTGPVVRPLLDIDRGDLRRVADVAGLPYRDDPENLVPDHLRNRVRHELLPLMTDLEPAVRLAVERLADNLEEHTALLEATDGIVVERSPEGVRASVGRLLAADDARRRQRIRSMISAVRGPLAPSRSEVDRVDAALRTGSVVELESADEAVRVVGPWLEISVRPPPPPPPSRLGGEVRWGSFVFRTTEEHSRPGPRLSKWRFAHGGEQLTVRAPDPGDRIPMRAGSKSVTEALREQGFDPRRHPVVTSEAGVVWLPGARHGWSATQAKGYLVTVAEEDSRWAPSEP